MSRTIRLLAEAEGMAPDEYLRAHGLGHADETGWGDAPPAEPTPAEPPNEPAPSKTSRHDRRRYDALRRRMQVR